MLLCQVFYEDACAWLKRPDEATGLFDIIIMDIVDPTEAGPGVALYTKEFYEVMKSKLAPGGVFVTQSGPAGVLNHKECFTVINNTLETVFDHVLPYSAEVPSFGSLWGFNVAFDSSAAASDLTPEQRGDAGRSFKEMTGAEVDARLALRVSCGSYACAVYACFAHCCHFEPGLKRVVECNSAPPPASPPPLSALQPFSSCECPDVAFRVVR